MTKTLGQIQEENRKFILEAIYGCNYEEALQKELGFGCKVKAKVWNNIGTYIIDNLTCFFDGYCLRFRELVGDISKKDLTDDGLQNLKKYESAKHRILSIIGKPLTLNRVLLAFKNKNVKINGNGIVFDYDWGKFCSLEDRYFDDDGYPRYIFSPLFDWDLTKETLEEQSEETQRVINQLLTGK